MSLSRSFLLPFNFVLIAGLSACGSGSKPDDAVTLQSITVTPQTMTIEIGKQVSFTATGQYSNSTTQDLTASVTWLSNNEDVLRIDSDGLATALKAGDVIVNAGYNNIFSNSPVNVAVTIQPVHVQSESENSVTLQWRSGSAENYSLYWSTNGDANENSDKISDIVGTEYTLNNIDPSKTYSFKLGITLDGKQFLSAHALSYKKTSGKWLDFGASQHTGEFVHSAYYNNKLYLFNGVKGSTIAMRTTELDLRTLATNGKTTPGNYHAGSAFCTVDTFAFFVGGFEENTLSDKVDVYDMASDTWMSFNNLPTAQAMATCQYSDGKLFVFGGQTETASLSDVQILDLNNNEWITGTANTTARQNAASAINDNRIYYVGGSDNTDFLSTADVYDISTDTWSSLPALPIPLAGLSAVHTGNHLLVMGGHNVERVSNRVFELSTDETTWTEKHTLPYARSNFSIARNGSKLHIAGGFTYANNKLDYSPVIESYDIESDKWFPREYYPRDTSYYASAILDRNIYVAGGHTGATPSTAITKTNVDVYDIVLDKWHPSAPLVYARSGLTLSSVNNKLYAIGGFLKQNTYLAYVEEFDPQNNTWTTRTPMPTARSFMTTEVVNNKIYVMGGVNGGVAVEAYDPATDRWETKAPLPKEVLSAASVVYNGEIYVIGGASTKSDYKTILIYNPELNSWREGVSMQRTLYDASAELINGKIYVFGGVSEDALASVSIYDPFTQIWSEGPAMRRRVYAPVTVNDNNTIYLIGGMSNATTISTLIQILQ